MREAKNTEIKLVVFDLDDTLLDSRQGISARTSAAIRQVAQKGIAIMLATGRMYASTVKFAQYLELAVPLITYNGAMVKAFPSGELLFHQPIDPEAAAQVLALCREQRWHIQTYIDDVLYVREINRYASLYARITDTEPVAVGDRLYALQAAPTKMLVIAEPDTVQQIKAYLVARLGNRLYIAESKPNFLEITHPSVHKGAALRWMAEQLKIDRHHIMAFGNGGNDIEMLRYAGWGIAVGNSPAEVKKAARLVTDSHDEDGVAKILEKVNLHFD